MTASDNTTAPEGGATNIGELIGEAINDAIAMRAAMAGEHIGDKFHAMNWQDKPHRVVFDACDLIDRLVAALCDLTADPPTPPAPVGVVEKVRAYLAAVDAVYNEDFDERDEHSDAEWKERDRQIEEMDAGRLALDTALSAQPAAPTPAGGDLRPGLEEAIRALEADAEKCRARGLPRAVEWLTLGVDVLRARLAEQPAPADPIEEMVRLSQELREDAAFALGERVEKISGSSWRGRIVGTYSTSITPRGYNVESEREPGSVHIYPESALRPVPDDLEADSFRKGDGDRDL